MNPRNLTPSLKSNFPSMRTLVVQA